MTGDVVDVLGQDLNLVTGNGRVWGRGVIETDLGTWRTVWKARYTGFVLTSQAVGRGSGGLEGQGWYWEGQSTGIGEPDPCPDGALQALFGHRVHRGTLTLAGVISPDRDWCVGGGAVWF